MMAVISYNEHSETVLHFLKRVVLLYPTVKAPEYLHIIVPRKAASALQVGQFFSTASPNVTLHIFDSDVLHPDGEPETNCAFSEHNDTGLTMLDATKQMLVAEGIQSPFDTGLIFTHLPASLALDLEADFGLDPSTLERLEIYVDSWDFNAHECDANELLGVLFILFKRVMADPGLPADARLSDENLLWFLAVCRALYSPHVPYHSYWHSVDVAQLAFALINSSPEAWRLDAATRLAMMLAAIGHDMKHPGLVVQVISSVDKQFTRRWESLEAYHIEIFETVLGQLWPCIRERWSRVVEEAIEATEMAKHTTYMTPGRALSMVHILKISDFASAVRKSEELSDITAALVFKEFYIQALLCRSLGESQDMPPQKIDMNQPSLKSFVSLQLSFFDHVVLPYFEWVAQRVPWFEHHLKVARHHHDRYQNMKDLTDHNTLPKHLLLLWQF